MGWASGGEIFDLVAHGLIEAGASDEIIGRVCYRLASALTDQDWDTVDESIDEFAGHPAVQDALRRADGRYQLDYDDAAIMDYDPRADEWELTIDGAAAGRRPGTAQGHDELVEIWFAQGPDTRQRRATYERTLLR